MERHVSLRDKSISSFVQCMPSTRHCIECQEIRAISLGACPGQGFTHWIRESGALRSQRIEW